jgi:glycosyltransferase involved in cell wall biosynthesis
MLLNIEPLRSAGIPLLADQVDDSFLRLKRDLHRVTNWYSKLWIIKQIILQWRFAKRYLANAEAVLFVSDADVRFFKRLFPLANAVVIENGVDEAYFKPQPLAPEDETIGDPEIVFEGAMCFSPNIDAACFMACEIFPLIRREIPDVRLTLVGRDPVAEVEDLATIDGVEVTGTVPDIRPYLQRAQVFICPMRTGAGIKNKILQAWAMGKAIVSTNEGSGGLKVIDGKNIVIRNTPQSFATSVVELLRDPVKACQLGVAGRETVLAHYTWAAKAEEFEKLMISIVREHKTKTLDRQLKEKRCG